MQKTSMLTFFLLATVFAFAQEKSTSAADTAKAKPIGSVKIKVPHSFKYRKELDNIAFISGGTNSVRNFEGWDSLSFSIPSRVTVASMYLGKYEVSNAEYRSFVHYVKDSIAHALLGHFIIADGNRQIDWNSEIDWGRKELEDMMTPHERIYAKRQMDERKFIFRFSNGDTTKVYPDTLTWIVDCNYAYNEPMAKRYFSHPSYADHPVVGINYKQALAYCNWKTTTWNNELIKHGDDKHFFAVRLPSDAEWERAAVNLSNKNKKGYYLNSFSVYSKQITVPSEELSEMHTSKNVGYNCNFGQIKDINDYCIKDFTDDGYFYTAPSDAYKPNYNGLYNLHGNVAEWTSTKGYLSRDFKKRETGKSINRPFMMEVEILKPSKENFPNSPLAKLNAQQIESYLQQFMIVKGGSWFSIPFYLQPGASQFFLPAASHSFIGFRIAVDYFEKQ
jgi:sulfatase modifying factor 1